MHVIVLDAISLNLNVRVILLNVENALFNKTLYLSLQYPFAMKTIPIEVACGPRDLPLGQEGVEIFDLQLAKGNVVFFKVVIERESLLSVGGS